MLLGFGVDAADRGLGPEEVAEREQVRVSTATHGPVRGNACVYLPPHNGNDRVVNAPILHSGIWGPDRDADLASSVQGAAIRGYRVTWKGVVPNVDTDLEPRSSERKAGTRVNAVGPGFIKMPLLDDILSKDQMDDIAALLPMKRMGTAEEAAEFVLWPASDKASFVTGSYYNANGGYVAQRCADPSR